MDTPADNIREISKKLCIAYIIASPLIIFQIFSVMCLKGHAYSEFGAEFLIDYASKTVFFILLLNIMNNVNCDKFVFLFLFGNIIYAEVLIHWNRVGQAYISFLISYISINGIAVYNYKRRAWLISIQVISVCYALTSACIHFNIRKDFPAEVFMSCYIYFLALLFPMQAVYAKFQGYIKMQDSLIADFKCILEALPYGIAILTTEDSCTGIYAANSTLMEFFGSSNEFNKYLHSDEFMNASKNTRIELNGKIANIQVTKSSFKLFKKDGYVFTLHDTTDITANEEKQARENMKWLFVNTANHQLRTPLSAIDSLITMVLPEIKEDEPKKNLQVASLAVTNLRHIIDDTILLSDAESTHIKLQAVSFKLKDLCNEILQLFIFEATRAEIQFSVECPLGNGNKELLADKGKILHVIYTLISNAIKYTPRGYVKVNLLLTLNQNDNLLEIKVEDSGLGMDEEVQSNMYKIFSNEKECKKSLKVSTGLGLHVAKLITNAMGGEIKFKSCKQKGTTATITMKVFTPLTEVEKFEQSISQNAFKNGLNKLKRSIEKVLVVDDNMSNVYVLKKMLKSIGVDSDEAHNGAEAVDRFRKNPYRLIFMDVNMPVMNGLDASLLIIKEKVPTMIIALTAQDELSELDYKSYGINKWVVKPISLKAIKEIISQL